MKQIVIFIVLIILAGIGAIYIFGNPLTNEIGKVDISTSSVPKPVSMTEHGFYQVYYPKNYDNSTAKIMILVLQPSGDFMGYIRSWQAQSDLHGFALAAIPDWNSDLITQFNIDARQNLGVNKIFYTGFSHGGYVSCERGLSNQKYVDGIIPMGAYCNDYDLVDQVQSIPILTIIGSLDNYALDSDLVRPDQREYSSVSKINTEYVIIPGLGHQFPTSYMDEVGRWVMEH